MTALNKHAQLRKELSNPAIGSKDQLRKLAKSLLDDLEVKEEQRANWFQMAQKLGEDLDVAEKRIAELEAEKETLRPVGVMSEGAFRRLENSESRFIALWPRPGIYLPRKRPDDGVIVYARTAAGIGVKGE
ncbi:hypothetical protein L3B45_004304 [Citrobacter freundii]